MALEFVVADMLATVYRATVDPVHSLELKRSRFRWLMEENRSDISDAMSGKFYLEELQTAIDQLLLMAQALARKA
jgi:hypothetical protein